MRLMLVGRHRAVTNVDKERAMTGREAECADDGMKNNRRERNNSQEIAISMAGQE
jgi:hypothetical protein